MALLSPPATAPPPGGLSGCRPGSAPGRFLEQLAGSSAAALRAVFAWMGGAWRCVWLVAPGMFLVFGEAPVFAQVAKAPEYSLKAAYLYNFTQFIEWPGDSFTSADAPIVIGVLGEDPFGGALDQAVKNKTAHGRSFEIKRFKQIGELRACHVLFVSGSEAKRLPEILAAVPKKGVLTVSDIDRFAEQGGVINFYMENNKVRFKMNLSAAGRAGVKISSQLLRLGTIIREKGDAEK